MLNEIEKEERWIAFVEEERERPSEAQKPSTQTKQTKK